MIATSSRAFNAWRLLLVPMSSSSSSPRKRPPSPVKLTPLEKKARDRERLHEQAARRKQRIAALFDGTRELLLAQSESAQWHEQERLEEELVLRRLERDLIDPQKLHPSVAGYRFSPSSAGCDATRTSPVFQGHAFAHCPSSEQVLRPPTHCHPSFMGYTITHHTDTTQLSPVFFRVGFQKIPLEEISLEDEESDASSDEGEGDEARTQEQFLSRMDARTRHPPTRAKLTPTEQKQLDELLVSRLEDDTPCAICENRRVLGCPGCFSFDWALYRKIQADKSTQRLKTPKTHTQEAYEFEERHKGLQRRLMGFEKAEERDERVKTPSKDTKWAYYAHALADDHAIRKHRILNNNVVILHIKSLPVGNLITLQVDVQASIASVYELYRSNHENPNRRIHLLLPTTTGLFYLDDALEDATDTRTGLVNGAFLLQDFHLTSHQPSSPLRTRAPLEPSTTITEYMLFSVALLSDESTPLLVRQYLQQNFHLADDFHQRLAIERATVRLPHAVALDACQQRLIPHVHRMKAFAQSTQRLDHLERERERERVLWIAYQEKKRAKLEFKKRQQQLGRAGRGASRIVMRAVAYLDYVCESTSNPRRARVAEERLGKLWQCFQRFEEWKICKSGRLLDAESTEDTLKLLQRHQDVTVAAFDTVMKRGPGSGPLLYPVLCVGGSTTRRLAVKIGNRFGLSEADNYEYGLVLDVEQDFSGGSTSRVATLKRDFTKKQLLAQQEDDQRQRDLEASWRCADLEWRIKNGSTPPPMLFTATDLLRPPFYQFPWHSMAQAYQFTLQSVAFQVAKLDEFNALARVLQHEDAILSKAQIEKWGQDVDRFHDELVAQAESTSPLLKTSVLLAATRRVLQKKGLALLKKRLKQRKQRLREREAELERLRLLQEENDRPKRSPIELMKDAFVKEHAPKLLAVLELTPAEKLLLKAEQLVGKVATKAASAAKAAKKEYHVRAL
ncbi:hypothetical protein Poli38472_000191 [Pythium oligandrum]|uniref:Uncharacterized protein n=1 Tax=Pythium oligandrum TaxID=41045 RepID=A0A8K1FGM1_PYTOL|nr:hypothetical protein Poli38472_000191 [Pythium oligandrum]|eukprot:TMW60149.1 hypothetical protein Poli38472_000191 [Pythium oligandrum]